MNLDFRRVTSGDYDEVIAIRRGVYDGLDYLTARYHSMMETHQGYVAMDVDKMVGFAFVTTIDDGTSFLTQAARVHEDYEGKGVYRSLSDYIHRIIKTNPEIKRSAFVVHTDTETDRLVTKGAILVGKREVRVFQGKASSVLPLINEVIENKPLHRDAISKTFQSTKLSSILFPYDRIVSNRVAYRLVPSNLKHFDSDLDNVIATSADPENVSGTPLLSVGVSFRCDAGEALCIDFHGDIGEGSKVREHIEKHVKLSIGPLIDNFLIMVTYEAKMDDNLLQNMMKDFSMTEKMHVGMNLIEQSI